MKLFRIIFFSLLTILALAGGGIYYASTQIPTWIHDKAQEFGQKTGYLIDFKDFNYSIKDPKISFSDFKIVKLSNQESILTFSQLDAKFKWGPLLNRRVEIEGIVLKSPMIYLHKEKKLNLTEFIHAIKNVYPSDSKVPSTSSAWIFNLNALQVSNALIKIDYPKNHFKNDFAIQELQLKRASNSNDKGEIIGLLQSEYQMDLANLKLNIPNSAKVLETGPIKMGGDLLVNDHEDVNIKIKSIIGQGKLNANIDVLEDADTVNCDLDLQNVSMIPILQMETPHSPRSSKTGIVSGKIFYASKKIEDVIKADLKISQVSIPPLLELLPTNIHLIGKSGMLDTNIIFEEQKNLTSLSGDMTISNLSIFESDKTSELMAWKTAFIKHFDVKQIGKQTRLRLEEIIFDGINARFTLFADKSNNFARMFPPSEKEVQRIKIDRAVATEKSLNQLGANPNLNPSSDSSTKSVKSSEDLFDANVKSITLKNSDVTFTDFSVKPNFKADIRDLHGTLIGLSTHPERYAAAAFDGLVGPQGDVKVRGKIAFEDPRRNNDIQLSFRRIPLQSINPYYTNLAGYDVLDGTMSYDSSFQTKDGTLVGENRFIINQIRIGERNPNYQGTFIPMKLVTSLLEDKDGVIELNLSVKGNVDNPEFEIGKLMWDAFFTIVGNIIKSPFIAIGRLLGIDDLKGIYFDAGSKDLRPSEILKLEKIATGLEKRPKLQLKIEGVYDSQNDARQIATDQVNRQIFKKGGFNVAPNEPLPKLPLSDERIQRAIKRLCVEQDITIPNDLNLTTGAVGEAGFNQLHQLMIERIKIPEENLKLLAKERAEVVKQEVIKLHAALASRLQLTEIKSQEIEKDGIPIGVAFVQ